MARPSRSIRVVAAALAIHSTFLAALVGTLAVPRTALAQAPDAKTSLANGDKAARAKEWAKAATEYENGCIAATVPASKAGGAPVQVAQCFTDTTFLDITQSISVKIEPSPDGSAQVMIVIDRIW